MWRQHTPKWIEYKSKSSSISALNWGASRVLHTGRDWDWHCLCFAEQPEKFTPVVPREEQFRSKKAKHVSAMASSSNAGSHEKPNTIYAILIAPHISPLAFTCVHGTHRGSTGKIRRPSPCPESAGASSSAQRPPDPSPSGVPR